jgi:hypothetical protein
VAVQTAGYPTSLSEHRWLNGYAGCMARNKAVGPYAPARVRTAERRRQALNLRAAGADFRSIGAALGISVGQAYADVQTEMHAVTRESAEQVLAMDLARLDQLQAAVWADARSGDVAAVECVRRIVELRQRLFGNLRCAGVTVNTTLPQPPPGAVLIIGGSKSEYIAGLRAARGEPPAPPAQNGNGNGHTASSEWIQHGID